MRNILILLLSSFLAGCICALPNADATVETLQKTGFTNIQTTGYAPLQCGKGDSFSTGFVADNPHGDRVEGVVCCGWLKSCTIRF